MISVNNVSYHSDSVVICQHLLNFIHIERRGTAAIPQNRTRSGMKVKSEKNRSEKTRSEKNRGEKDPDTKNRATKQTRAAGPALKAAPKRAASNPKLFSTPEA